MNPVQLNLIRDQFVFFSSGVLSLFETLHKKGFGKKLFF